MCYWGTSMLEACNAHWAPAAAARIWREQKSLGTGRAQVADTTRVPKTIANFPPSISMRQPRPLLQSPSALRRAPSPWSCGLPIVAARHPVDAPGARLPVSRPLSVRVPRPVFRPTLPRDSRHTRRLSATRNPRRHAPVNTTGLHQTHQHTLSPTRHPH